MSKRANIQSIGNDEEIEAVAGDDTISACSSMSSDHPYHATPHSCSFQNGHWVCKPYKIEVLAQQLSQNSPGSARRTAIIETLKSMGVKVFVITSDVTHSTEETMRHIRRVVGYVARENCVTPYTGPLGFQRCLLYQDEQGRLFNLMLSKHAVGPATKYEEYLDGFSGREAMIALTVLSRSLPCMVNTDMEQNFRPAYISLILGMVLTEEMSLSALYASMMVRATPSVSAHNLTAPVDGDLMRKIVIFALALAGATDGVLQKALTIGGILGACVIMLANLGARSWHFLRWKPIQYNGIGSFGIAYILAVFTGILVPYMGHRSISVGGKAAMEYIIKTSFVVAAVFVISDLDQIQKFLVVGSEQCSQDIVNHIVGAWWTVSLIVSLFLVRKVPHKEQKPQNGERLLVEDHASPVGYKVPSLPDFEIDPSLANTGSKWLPLQIEFLVGLIMAFGVGGVIIALAYTNLDEAFNDDLQNAVKGIVNNSTRALRYIIGTNYT